MSKVPLITCLFACLLLYGFSTLIERSFEKYSTSKNKIELLSVIDSIELELSYYDPNKEHNQLIQNILLIQAHHYQLSISIIGESNNILYKTRGPNLLDLYNNQINADNTKKNKDIKILHYENSSYLTEISYFTACNNEQFTIIVAVDQNIQLEFIAQLRNGLLVFLTLSCGVILAGTTLTMYLAQKPINQLIKKMSLVDTKNLKIHIPRESVPAKYVSLVDAFNEMISRMDNMFERQHNFTADIAHEMRTPITNLTTQTQIALNNARTADEYKEVLYSNLEEFEKLSQIITDMLFLAQADNKLLIPKLSRINLTDMFVMMFDCYEYLSEDKNISLKLEGDCPIILGDKLMVGRVIGNLLSNALRYTPSGQDITVTLSQVNTKWVKIVIANPGSQIEAKHLPFLFDRFYRPDESRQRNGEGAGIGLAIVKSIIEAHNGNIFVESDSIATRFIIELPQPAKIKKPHN